MVDDGAGAPRIRVVWGAGTGPTAVASYDAALADANVHDYNLASLSSVVPPGATVEAVGTAPDLGPVGGRIWVVQARETVEGPGRATAALGWATDDSGGVFYEAAGQLDEDEACNEVTRGLAAAFELRGRAVADEVVESVTIEATDTAFATAVVLAVYGEVEPLFDSPRPR